MLSPRDPSSLAPEGESPRGTQDALFIPIIWDRRIPLIHRLLGISLGVLVPYGLMLFLDPQGVDPLWPLLAMMAIALPYRATFVGLSVFALAIPQNRFLDGSVLVLGLLLLGVGRLQRLPFWVNAYLVRYAIIGLSFWCITRIGQMY